MPARYPSCPRQPAASPARQKKYLTEAEKIDPDKYSLMLYYGALFLFARSTLYTMESSDVRYRLT